MPEQAAVLFANDAFYGAFTTRDPDARNDIWARSVPATCVHPGWDVIVGRDGVMDSWCAILASPKSPLIALPSSHGLRLG
jgi:hypothetical protein